jgi:hypothetical protein
MKKLAINSLPITPIYFKGYLPINSMIIIAKINAVVEKLEGRININVTKTGSQFF